MNSFSIVGAGGNAGGTVVAPDEVAGAVRVARLAWTSRIWRSSAARPDGSSIRRTRGLAAGAEPCPGSAGLATGTVAGAAAGGAGRGDPRNWSQITVAAATASRIPTAVRFWLRVMSTNARTPAEQRRCHNPRRNPGPLSIMLTGPANVDDMGMWLRLRSPSHASLTATGSRASLAEARLAASCV